MVKGTEVESVEEIVLNIESNEEDGFFSIYAGLRLLMDFENKWQIEENKNRSEGDKIFSIIGAEAYCRIEDLKVNYPQLSKDAELRYINYKKEL